jgi:predicted component of type VI protein secretion system
MAVRLRVVHGTLRRQHGGSAGEEVKVHGARFVIGSGMDCQLRCASSSISPQHCEIVRQEGQYVLRDLASESGTFLNGERLTGRTPLREGDLLRVGRLEFEVVVPAAGVTDPTPQPLAASDPVGEEISEMLVEADLAARAQRLEDPARRRYTAAAPVPPPAAARPEVVKKPVLPPRQPPKKLPPPPPVVADSTVQAAEQVLKKIFEKPKK